MELSNIWSQVSVIVGYVTGLQFVADMAHLTSLVLLSKKIALSGSCKGSCLATRALHRDATSD